MHRIRSWARQKALGSNNNPFAADTVRPLPGIYPLGPSPLAAIDGGQVRSTGSNRSRGSRKNASNTDTSAPNARAETLPADGPTEDASSQEKVPVLTRFYLTTHKIILSSWINVLLVFVPAGIAVNFAKVSPTIIFVMNAIAIVPLAGMLSYATESVASKMGDTVGALMNVTFGNAVELIIFIALVKNEIRIVQASLLGSILANLLLILGMCFLIGGLRFQEQVYNSTVTQMSACLLSLSVISLLLPTAFHASFADTGLADHAVLKVSRGVSVILLLIYLAYLFFQLKSHAYIYESTPQHIIDEESHPGLLHGLMDSSTSTSSSDTSTDSTDGDSSGSTTTGKRIKKLMRRGRKRASTSSSKEVPRYSHPTFNDKDDLGKAGIEMGNLPALSSQEPHLGAIMSGDEADSEAQKDHGGKSVNFSKGATTGDGPSKGEKIKSKKERRKRAKRTSSRLAEDIETGSAVVKSTTTPITNRPPINHTGESTGSPTTEPSALTRPKRNPFNIRAPDSLRAAFPTLTNTYAHTSSPLPLPERRRESPNTRPPGSRRAHSLPSRLPQSANPRPTPYINPVNVSLDSLASDEDPPEHISRTAAVVLLLASTGLVALCAEFLVGSIGDVVKNTGLSEAFVGLIILPIVGNAAEHVTAVTVASKNKMDLAIGVAVGSSIQIALFVTPVIVLLGWILNKAMSLYFNLFETVSLFVSAFIVNFLVLDGRSNYLEGSLLCAAYVIIAVAAFFYPDSSQQSVGAGPA